MSNTARRHSPQCEGRALGPEGVGEGGGGMAAMKARSAMRKSSNHNTIVPHVLMIKRPAHSNSHRSIFPQ